MGEHRSWHRKPCDVCGAEELASRTEPKDVDAPYVCEACEMHQRGYDEGYERGLREGREAGPIDRAEHVPAPQGDAPLSRSQERRLAAQRGETAPSFVAPKPCATCDGCGRVADTDDREPWTAWESLPPGADVAVRMGLVRPVPCPDCASESRGDHG